MVTGDIRDTMNFQLWHVFFYHYFCVPHVLGQSSAIGLKVIFALQLSHWSWKMVSHVVKWWLVEWLWHLMVIWESRLQYFWFFSQGSIMVLPTECYIPNRRLWWSTANSPRHHWKVLISIFGKEIANIVLKDGSSENHPLASHRLKVSTFSISWWQ